MEAHGGSVLSHNPCVGVENFLNGVSGEAGQFRIPRGSDHVMPTHAFAQLHKRVLDVARMLAVVQIFANLLIRELPSKPGAPPKQERHQHDQPRSEEEEQTIARGHPMAGAGRRRWGTFKRDFGATKRLRTGTWSGHASRAWRPGVPLREWACSFGGTRGIRDHGVPRKR